MLVVDANEHDSRNRNIINMKLMLSSRRHAVFLQQLFILNLASLIILFLTQTIIACHLRTEKKKLHILWVQSEYSHSSSFQDGIRFNEHGLVIPFFKNYAESHDKRTTMLVDEFLSLYFAHYDSNSRLSIEGFYDENAKLGISTTFSGKNIFR